MKAKSTQRSVNKPWSQVTRADFIIPPLHKGKGRAGPEFYGCINTGTRPVIHRHLIDGAYIVGAENDVADVRNYRCYDRFEGKPAGKERRTWNVNNRIVKVFKTRAPAVAYYLDLCMIRVQQNAAAQGEANDARANLATGNPNEQMAAILTLNDHGQL